jgi:UPF0271 protein
VNKAATIDLNVDFGESDNGSPSPDELAILGTASSINLSCGVHAGNVPLLRAILRAAAALPIAVGAHPSYDDRPHFGRRETGLAAAAIEPLVAAQMLGLMALALESGTRIRYIKAHGALYHRTAHDAEAAAALCRVARGTGPRVLPILGPAGSALESAAKRARVKFFREGLLDRGYRADGTLVPRGEPGDLITDSDDSGLSLTCGLISVINLKDNNCEPAVRPLPSSLMPVSISNRLGVKKPWMLLTTLICCKYTQF